MVIKSEMNASDNLICLDSSSAFSSSTHNINNGVGASYDVKNQNENSSAGGTDILIDLADEIQVPLPPAIMTRAEVDDTFGIFSLAHCSQETKKDDSICSEGSGNDNDASKLIRSFTLGRKSEEKPKKVAPKIEENFAEVESRKNEEHENGDTSMKNDDNAEEDTNKSTESCTSDQPTVVDSSEFENILTLSPSLPVVDGDEVGISDEKMELPSTNISGGSDSDYLDVHNLSSFSIPDADVNTSDFVNDIKKKDMHIVETSVSAAIVKQIKLELLCEEKKCDDNIFAYRSSKYLGLHGVTNHDYNITTDTTISSVSTSSSAPKRESVPLSSTRARLSCRSENGEVPKRVNFGESAECFKNANEVGDFVVKPKSRLSTDFMNSSPIRASYPVSKFYMPTPNSKTPSRLSSSSVRDRKMSESVYSPSRTRNVLVTGQTSGSPLTKVPVRKSISVETLHYDKSPLRDPKLQAPKFSTPSASKSRYSFIPESQNQEELGSGYSHSLSRNRLNTSLRSDAGDEEVERANALYFQYRQGGRLSYASNASSVSVHCTTLNSTGASSVATAVPVRRESEIIHLAQQMTHLNAGNGPQIASFGSKTSVSSSVQPMKATAIIPPTREFTSEAQALNSTVRSRGRPTTTAPAGTKRNNIAPRAASSPRIGASPSCKRTSGISQTTPTRASYAGYVKSSGYGPQNLNSTFESKLKSPLTSPNKDAHSTSASIKPALSKSVKGVPATGSKIGVSGIKKLGTGLPAPKILKAPAVTVTAPSGLRRPSTFANKENSSRSALGSRIGIGRPRQ